MKILFVAGFAHDIEVYNKVIELAGERGHDCDFLELEEARNLNPSTVEDYDVLCCHSLGAKATVENGWFNETNILYVAPVMTHTLVNVELVANLLRIARRIIPEGVQENLSMKTVSTKEDAVDVTASFMRMDVNVLTNQLKWLIKPVNIPERSNLTKKSKIIVASKDQIADPKDAKLIGDKLNIDVEVWEDLSHSVMLDDPLTLIMQLEELAR